ncbi:L,D-peptidoglycan transpeptidase YkuD (ErfK/YbiS/YcfS/YnhG family) [Marmoricola sp. URHA0025 HA25]
MIGWFGPLVAAVLLALGGTSAPANTPAAGTDGARVAVTGATGTHVVLDGVRVALPAGGGQVVTVNHTSGSRARVSLWQLSASGWQLVARSRSGHTGYGGLVRPLLRKQATGTTPLGTYDLMWSFGTHPADPAWRLTHRRIAPGDYWVEDNRSAYYNRYRNKAEGGFRWSLPESRLNSSELLTDFPRQYEYAIVTSFNYDEQVRHRGAGIFLHVNGRGATAGCASAPRWFLRTTLATLDPALHPVIAIGR